MPFITPLDCCSSRFCAVKLCDSNCLSVLIVCIYMPGDHNQNSFDAYLSVLGELEGFLDSHGYDLCLLVGDFNVDFDRDGCLKDLLLDFMSNLDLCACDRFFRDHNYSIHL